jgi:hypothetical protein
MTNAQVIEFVRHIPALLAESAHYLTEDEHTAVLADLEAAQAMLEEEGHGLACGQLALVVQRYRHAVQAVRECRASSRRARALRTVEDQLLELRDADVHRRLHGHEKGCEP